MNKTLLLSVGAIVVIGLFALAYRLTGTSVQTPSSIPSPSAQTGGHPAITSGVQNTTATATSTSAQAVTMSVTDANGGYIQTSNFLADPSTVKDSNNSGYYYLGYHTKNDFSGSSATVAPPYIIAYIDSTNYFNIALLQEPIGITREEAQQYIMAHLGITENQMCRLNYMISVPYWVNSQYAGKNLGFSFCPGATVLPQ